MDVGGYMDKYGRGDDVYKCRENVILYNVYFFLR